jgi:soluble cytochrome b562
MFDNIPNQVSESIELELKKGKHEALGKIKNQTHGFITGIIKSISKHRKIIYFSTALMSLSNIPLQAMTQITADKFNEAGETGTLLQNENKRNLELQRALEQITNPTTQDSLALNESYAKLDSLVKTAETQLEEAFLSFENDLDMLIYDDKVDQIKKDIIIIIDFATRANNKDMLEKAEEMQAYTKDLFQKRIIASHLIAEANAHAQAGNVKEARKSLEKTFNLLKNYPHLEWYVVDNYIKIFFYLSYDVKKDVDRGDYDRIQTDLNEMAKLVKHDNLDPTKQAILQEGINKEIASMAEEMLKNALQSADWSHYDKMEETLSRMHKELGHLDIDSLKSVYHPKLAQIMMDAALKESKHGAYDASKFDVAIEIVKRSEMNFFNQTKIHSDARYQIGIDMMNHIESEVSKGNYKEALEFLESKEKTYWKGTMNDLRTNLANNLHAQAKASGSVEKAQKMLDWANIFEKGRSLGAKIGAKLWGHSQKFLGR